MVACVGIVLGVRNQVPLLYTGSIIFNVLLIASTCFLPVLIPAKRSTKPSVDLTHIARLVLAGRISASIVHQIIQPISAILLNIEALEFWFASKSGSIAIAENILGDLKRDELRTREMVFRLHRFFSKGELHTEHTDMNELVANAVELLRPNLRGSHVVVSTEFVPGPLAAMVDRVHMQQVLITLIVNAIEAMAEVSRGARWLHISTDRVAHHSLEITVTDSGPEMSQEQFEHAFDPFFTTKENGMGLGLSVARSIVVAHHGLIWIQRRSTGTSFHLEVPVSQTG